MMKPWPPSLDVAGCLRWLVVVGLVFGLAGCNRDNSHRLRLYVYPDATGKHALFVNDQPVATLHMEKGSGPVAADIYQGYYLIKSLDPKFHVAIKAGDIAVYEASLEPGKYIVNLSEEQDIWFEEIAYGRDVGSGAQAFARGKLGVHRLGKLPYGIVFKFDQEPPEAIRTRRGGTDTEYFLLGTFTEKGLAMRRKLAQQDSGKHKEDAAAKGALPGKFPEGGVIIGRPEAKSEPQ